MKVNYLYIDELGNPNPSSPRHDYFILSTCSVPDKTRSSLDTRAAQIRYKYWGAQHNNIAFHSFHIGRKSGAFAMFRNDPLLYNEFLADLLGLLRDFPITVFVNLTDNAVARAMNWDMQAVLNKATTHAVDSFVHFLVGTRKRGKIVIESATDAQNSYFLDAFTTYLAPNAIPNISFRTIQDSLTSLSVVTKNNNDIGEQIADLFAYAAKCKYERGELGKSFVSSSYESKLITVLEKKLYKVPANASTTSKRVLNKIQPFKILTN